MNTVLEIILGNTLAVLIIYFLIKKFVIPLSLEKMLERIRQDFRKELVNVKHEFGLVKSSYDKYLDKILEYYSAIYRLYKLCQNVVNYQESYFPSDDVKSTKQQYDENLNEFVDQCRMHSGIMRLILPEEIIKADENVTKSFNFFKNQFQLYSELTEDKKLTAAFKEIDKQKNELESQLRKLLRTEKLLEERIN